MGWVVNATCRPLYPRERPGTHCTGVWVGRRAGLDGCRKSLPPPEFDPQTVQPVASRYADCADIIVIIIQMLHVNQLLTSRYGTFSVTVKVLYSPDLCDIHSGALRSFS